MTRSFLPQLLTPLSLIPAITPSTPAQVISTSAPSRWAVRGSLKSTDAGATWTVLGADVFGMIYTEPPGEFPQYNAVGKVRVDPNNSSNVVAGTKQGLYFSYDGGTNWTGPCLTNNFSTQRQDVTGLELSDVGGGNTGSSPRSVRAGSQHMCSMIWARMEQTASTAPRWHRVVAPASPQLPVTRTDLSSVIRSPVARIRQVRL